MLFCCILLQTFSFFFIKFNSFLDRTSLSSITILKYGAVWFSLLGDTASLSGVFEVDVVVVLGDVVVVNFDVDVNVVVLETSIRRTSTDCIAWDDDVVDDGVDSGVGGFEGVIIGEVYDVGVGLVGDEVEASTISPTSPPSPPFSKEIHTY